MRTTAAQILAPRRITEGVRANNRKAIPIFIDFKKAFDSIHRGKMICSRSLRVYFRAALLFIIVLDYAPPPERQFREERGSWAEPSPTEETAGTPR
jgi:hypothetical protein